MQPRLNPYLNFNANAQKAVEFYKTVFGDKLRMTTVLADGSKNKYMKARVPQILKRIGRGL